MKDLLLKSFFSNKLQSSEEIKGGGAAFQPDPPCLQNSDTIFYDAAGKSDHHMDWQDSKDGQMYYDTCPD